MTGMRLPHYIAGSNAAGYHIRSITENEYAGGHVLDCRTSDVTVGIGSWRVEIAEE